MKNSPPPSQYFIGLMSGTSADGVDAALVEFKGGEILLHDFISPELPACLKQQLIQLNQTATLSLEQLAQLSFDLAQQFIQATQQLLAQNKPQANEITAIGSHGQTIFHAPHIPMTLQIGHPAFIAKTTKIQTVGDFRVDDMALSGQGAPFAPAFHQALLQTDTPCFVVNIGGIANISYLPSKPSKGGEKIIPLGYDTGPGNALMDEICQHYFDTPFDKAGDLAKQGVPNQALLNQLLLHPYFNLAHPKSTGRETFNLHWLNQQITLVSKQTEDNVISPINLISTLNHFTAITIANEIRLVIKQQNLPLHDQTPVWIVGGGAFNQHLIQTLQQYLSSCVVQSTEAIGLNPNAIEAMMCAWLAKQRIENKIVPLSQVTGAQRDAVLGGLWHP
ncbi:MAG: anhydro-N-acetylmuramic acid kinase [Thiomicrorhabdus sp.]|nr:anhydro-N-acetylmuramic acid kinase [Thiomicrorhabdus sp.]